MLLTFSCPSNAIELIFIVIIAFFSLYITANYITLAVFTAIASFAISSHFVNIFNNTTLESEYLYKKLTFTGKILSNQTSTNNNNKYKVSLIKVCNKKTCKKLESINVELNVWFKKFIKNEIANNYIASSSISNGSIISFKTALLKPHNFSNPGSYDKEKDFFLKGCKAYANVNKKDITVISNSNYQSIQESIIEKFKKSLFKIASSKESKSLILALSIGDKSNISKESYQLLQKTGVAHLFVISGLHIGLVSFYLFFTFDKIIRKSSYICTRMPSGRAALLLSFIGTLLYGFLTGLSIPTLRALLVFFIFFINSFNYIKANINIIFAQSLLLVLIIDPFAILKASFWLSFFAVFTILFVRYTIEQNFPSLENKFVKFLIYQFALSILLIPIGAYYFKTISLVSVLANIYASPIISIVILPLVLFLLSFSLIAEAISYLFNNYLSPFDLLLKYLVKLIDYFFCILIKGLSFLQEINYNTNFTIDLGSCLLLIIFSFCFFFFIIKYLNGILLQGSNKSLCSSYLYLCIVFLLSVFIVILYNSKLKDSIARGDFKVTFLDVGQGLSVFIQTANHNLLFDTGPKYSKFTNAGDRIILPFLEHFRIDNIDKLIISHNDSDHTGGMSALLKKIKIKEIVTSDIKALKIDCIACLEKQKWVWDDVSFEFLHPDKSFLNSDIVSKNNKSCVLKISNKKYSILLSADLEKEAEYRMLKKPGRKNLLELDILQVPHHGSASSSTTEFIRTVSPSYAVNSSGYKNSYGHPHKVIVNKYKNIGSIFLDTCRSGAISFFLSLSYGLKVSEYRLENKFFWSLP